QIPHAPRRLLALRRRPPSPRFEGKPCGQHGHTAPKHGFATLFGTISASIPMPLERADADLSARRMVGGPPTRGRRTRSGGEVSEAASRLVGQQSGTETAVERSRLGVLDLVLPL
ncbi:unnamed protein product, partial [Musa acuminata subsp. burmannicoides]